MLTKNINFKNFNKKFNNKKLKKYLKNILSENNEILKSLTSNYKYQYDNYLIKKFKNEKAFSVIGMGGSIIGVQAIHNFLKQFNPIVRFHFFLAHFYLHLSIWSLYFCYIKHVGYLL